MGEVETNGRVGQGVGIGRESSVNRAGTVIHHVTEGVIVIVVR